MKFRVYYEDTDAGGIMYHANFIKFCERARSEIFFNCGLNFTQNRHFVVTNIDASFLKPAFLGDILEVRTKILTLKKASLILNQEIFRDEILIFRAKVSVAFLINKKVAKMDNEILKVIEKFS